METSGKRFRNRILELMVLMVACWGMLFAQQVSVTLPALSVLPGSSVSIPVNVGSVTGLNILAYEFVVTCDSTIMSLDGVTDAGTLSSGLGPLSNNHANGFGTGRMKVVCAAALPLSGSGPLVYINGTIKNKPGSSTVQFEPGTFLLNATVQTGITNGSVRVNRPPTLTPVGAQTKAQGDSLSFTVTATDLDLPNDTLTFSMSGAPAGAALTKTSTSTANFGWRPNYTQVGPFSVRVKVTDVGGFSDSTIVGITVTKTNVKPNFVNKMRDTTINQGQTLTFTYTAFDLNGDPLTYNLVSPPSGASITPAGVFTWRPVYPVVGPSTVTAVVSDGLMQDIGSATVIVVRVNQKPVINSRVPTNVSTVSYNKPQTFAVSATDPNGDPITYKWVVNNQVIKSGTDTSYTTTFTDPHNSAKIVTAVCTDPDGLADSTMWFFTITDVQKDNGAVPTEFALAQNYPNPFNPTTLISFSLPKEAPVTFEIYDMLGVKIRTLMAGENRSAGMYTVSWDGRSDAGVTMPSGVYLYRVNAGSYVASKKMTLLK